MWFHFASWIFILTWNAIYPGSIFQPGNYYQRVSSFNAHKAISPIDKEERLFIKILIGTEEDTEEKWSN